MPRQLIISDAEAKSSTASEVDSQNDNEQKGSNYCKVRRRVSATCDDDSSGTECTQNFTQAKALKRSETPLGKRDATESQCGNGKRKMCKTEFGEWKKRKFMNTIRGCNHPLRCDPRSLC